MKNLEVFSIYSNFAAVFYMFRVMNYLIFDDFKPNDSWLNRKPQTFLKRFAQRKKSLLDSYVCNYHMKGGVS